MTKSTSHKRVQNKMAGPGGRTEVKLPSGRRLDALSRTKIATEVERQGAAGIRKAVSRLKESKRTGVALGAKLAVPDWHMGEAIKQMRQQGVAGRVQNLGDTRSFYVRLRKSTRRK